MRTSLLALALMACSAPSSTAPRPPVGPSPVHAPVADAPPPKPATSDVPALRLPKNFAPTGYDAHLVLDPGKPTFDGSITITGTVAESSPVIWLHGRHLQIQHATASQGATQVPLAVTPRGEELLELRADPPLAPGTWQLALAYRGELDLVNTTGAFKEVVAGAAYVYSQFEAIYARRVFPCVDEPDSKVPWQLAIDAPKGVIAVSNTAVEKETPLADGGHRYQFARTRPLPSYLVAFGVGPFDVVPAGSTKGGTPIRVITLAGRAADAAFAAKSAPRILEALEDWFGMPYPYDKLDLLTIPMTAGFGAMENAGLVTFRESLVLFDQQRPSWERRHTWVLVASHELAHQWFGDLVTTAWWDDLWLNEGFADWMEHKIVARFEPAWHDELGELDTRIGALGADSIVSARRIRQPIDKQDDILNAFDGITYNKGASVLNMFESYIGPDVFQQGVRAYLKARAYTSATSADFVGAVGKAAGKDLGPAFSTFLDQAGEPELAMTIACDATGAHLALAQHRYVPPGSPTPPDGKPWILPVCVAYDQAGKRAEACTVLDQPTGTLALAGKACPRWVAPNVNARGYYRTQLTASQLTALRDEAWPLLTWTERRTLVFELADAVRHPTAGTSLTLTLALSFVPKMLTGGDRFTIGDALGLPLGLDRLVADDQRTKYEAWLRATFGPGAARLGPLPRPGDDLDAEISRVALFGAAAWGGREPELVKQAVELAGAWRDQPLAMRGTLLAIAADASPEVFERILHDVRGERDQARRREMLHALGAVRDGKRLQAALALLLDPALDFRESKDLLFGTSSEANRQLAEQFFRDHVAELQKRMPADEVSGGLASVTWLFTGACDGAKRDAVAAYVTTTFAPLPGGERVVRQALESMDQCIASRRVLEPEIRGWLAGVKIGKPAAKAPAKADKPARKPKKAN